MKPTTSDDRDRQGAPTSPVGHLRRRLLTIERLIAAVVVVMLIVGVLLILWDVGVGIWRGLGTGSGDFGLTNLLSQALLALMIAEIIGSVAALLEGGVLDPVPLLVIGIIASIRRLLVISAEAANVLADDIEIPTSMLVELGILTAAIGIFAWSIRQVRAARPKDEAEPHT